MGWTGGRAYYGEELGAFAQLEITFADGHVQRVGTDETWAAGPSATSANDLYDGQRVDARRLSGAWLEPGFAGEGWVGTCFGVRGDALVANEREHRILDVGCGPASIALGLAVMRRS